MSGKSLLKKIVETSQKAPFLHRPSLGRGGGSTEFEHELAEGRRHDGRKHYEEWIIKIKEHIVERREEGQPTENGHLCELQLVAFYRRVRNSVSNRRREEREPTLT